MNLYIFLNNEFSFLLRVNILTFQFKYTVLSAAIFSCIFLSGCENDEKAIQSLNKKSIGVEEAKNVEIIYTTGGKTKAVLTAPLMLHIQESTPYYEFPQTLQTTFYNETGIIESRLTARYGKYKENENIVFLKDSVRVINLQKKDTLFCNELYWDRKRTGAEFYTEKAVRIRTQTQIIDGIGMEARQDFKSWLIKKSVGTVQVPASKFPM